MRPYLVMELTLNFNLLVPLCQQYGVSSLSLFGSFAREEQNADSDIDLLIEFFQNVSLLQLVSLERKFGELLGRKVDLVTPMSISPYLQESIYRDLKTIYHGSF